MTVSRRKFLGSALTIGASGLLANSVATQAQNAPSESLVLENELLTRSSLSLPD